MNYSIVSIPLLLALWFLQLPVVAQNSSSDQDSDQIAIPLSEPGKPGILKVQTLQGGIKVEGYSGKEVIVRYSAAARGRRSDKPETVEGMRRISDTNIGLEVQENRNEVSVKVSSWMKKADLVIMVPHNFSLNLRAVNDGLIEVLNVQGELDISNVNGSVLLHDIRGSALVNTVNGKIEARFTELPASGSMSFTNVNGEIQISAPAKAKFSIKAKTQFGDVYTNFDMKMRSETTRQEAASGGTYRVKIEDWVQGDVNGGGPEIYLKSLNGTIYIQKQ
ncbi:DUF4097 family beta strand repeat-containing protein [Cesiribacter andamanensis]|uniref:DUF4097 domain-containing protein n=1 Tax=Cesiribacter andamanensis AMV16 TaxID=1279009 RepID=M7N153_9BACT|nr:DUF4097 family beta strand repeat-containing protein [Cesiribacter andamanensis]EMR02403.1 hypothetical protein ADICEAN_02446 [Cesiribacter andamanensis AMV16]